jgi:ribosome-interacting GTPase 1
MGILEKIAEIEKEIARTQKNKGTNHLRSWINTKTFFCFLATEYHLGLLKAKLAKCRQALLEGDAKSGAGKVRSNSKLRN